MMAGVGSADEAGLMDAVEVVDAAMVEARALAGMVAMEEKGHKKSAWDGCMNNMFNVILGVHAD